MARGDAELRLRIPHDLRKALKIMAAKENRTMNAQIVTLLAKAVRLYERKENFNAN